MIPIVTPQEMAAVDRSAPEPVEILIGRAGAAVASAARDLLGGTYGRRVVVVAGKGNNGNDGRDAAARLARWGARVRVFDATTTPAVLPSCDLVVDAAYGTGFSGTYDAPDPGGAPVLAVDIPSGVDGLTGRIGGAPMQAVRTVTFAALKPGLVLHPGAPRAGVIQVADIGLDVGSARAHLVQLDDVQRWLPLRPVDSHKWRAAVWVIGGSPGMTGAAHLATRGAQRVGSGYVRLSVPGVAAGATGGPIEAVGHELPGEAWHEQLRDVERFAAVVVGPGLGRSEAVARSVPGLLARVACPVVVDGDGLAVLGRGVVDALARRTAATILTPHDGEFAVLTGEAPGEGRFGAVRDLAARTGAVVLLKGSTTLVGHPDGRVLVVTAGDERLATAGTGDVLAGIIAGLCAQGLEPFAAAAAGAELHGRAARLGPRRGLVASDVAEALPAVLAAIEA